MFVAVKEKTVISATIMNIAVKSQLRYWHGLESHGRACILKNGRLNVKHGESIGEDLFADDSLILFLGNTGSMTFTTINLFF